MVRDQIHRDKKVGNEEDEKASAGCPLKPRIPQTLAVHIRNSSDKIGNKVYKSEKQRADKNE